MTVRRRKRKDLPYSSLAVKRRRRMRELAIVAGTLAAIVGYVVLGKLL
jgi:hypothetical protein